MMNKESFRIHVLYLILVIQEKFNKMFGISCWFMVFNATFSTIFQLFCGSQFYCVGTIFSLAAILVGSRDRRTQIWKGAIQGPFHQSLVQIGPVASEELIKM
jgi:hypothetical protein